MIWAIDGFVDFFKLFLIYIKINLYHKLLKLWQKPCSRDLKGDETSRKPQQLLINLCPQQDP